MEAQGEDIHTNAVTETQLDVQERRTSAVIFSSPLPLSVPGLILLL